MKYNNFNKKHKSKNNLQIKLQKKTELELKLNERGVEFRSDSVLCAQYINGTSDLSLDCVVQRMCEMKYLYEYCDMKSIRIQTYNDFVANGYVKNFKGTISNQAEKIALETHSNGIYPDIFPWENKKNYDENYTSDEELDDKTMFFPFIPIFIFGFSISVIIIYLLELY
jgi:hypothetical protein